MKRRIFKSLFAIACLLSYTNVSAYDFKVNGIAYAITSFSNLECAVAADDVPYSGDIEIPSTVSFNGKELTVVAIGENAFKSNSNLTTVVIPTTIKTLGTSCFENCSGLKEINNTQFVTSLGKKAFSGCKELQYIDLSGLSAIEEYAFDGCTSLSKVEFGGKLSRIGRYAFRQCGFSEFIIPNTVAEIGENILSNCENLHSFTIGNGITRIDYNPIDNCNNLHELIIADGTEKLTFYNYSFSSLTADSVYIGRQLEMSKAFQNNNHLKSIKFGLNFTSFSPYWFQGCTSLENIEFSEITVIPDSFAEGAISLSKIDIPNSVKSIGNYAFQNCTALESISLGSKLTYISYRAFNGCEKISSIYCKGVTPPLCNTEFTNDVYLYCQLYIPLGAYSNYNSESPWNNFWNITESVDCVAEFTIDNLTYEVISGNNVKVVGNTFAEAIELTIPEKVEYHSISYNVTAIADNSFKNCKNFISITIPKTTMSIGNDVFNGCDNLKSVIIENGDTPLTLGYQTKLTLSNSIKPYPNAETVEEKRTGFRDGYYDGLFSGLPIEQLVINRDIRLPKYYERTRGTSTTSYPLVYNDIVYYPPFIDLSKLKSIEIGENVTAICEDTIKAVRSAQPATLIYSNFGECGNVEVVVSRNPQAPIGGIFAQSVYDNGYLVLPNGGVDSYKSNKYWKNFVNIQETEFVPIDSIRFESPEVIVDYNETKPLIVHVYPENASIHSLKWKSSSIYTVDVDSVGVVTSYSREGKATITATTSDGTNISATCTVEVVKGSGIESVFTNKQGENTIYTLDGVKRNTTNVSTLPEGIYIINGKKVMVK